MVKAVIETRRRPLLNRPRGYGVPSATGASVLAREPPPNRFVLAWQIDPKMAA